MARSLALIISLLASLALIPRSASAHQLCFADKTPHCFNDPFSDYWEQNGGLPVFGYPITAAANEANADTGQAYLTQWAERNRFEVHPENAGTPYAILLGLLGKDRLRQLGRGADPREAGPRAGCLWFEQTGINLCNQGGGLGFRQYWENHGLAVDGLDRYARSLQLFGLPLTTPREETNSSGDTVLTQWFERARFEWHPNEPDQFKVLLGLLGKEAMGGTPLPPPPPPPAGLSVLSHSSYVSRTGSRHIVGEILNNTPAYQEDIKVVASLYDANNTLVGSAFAYTEHETVKPGQRSPFDVLVLDSPATFHHYTLQLEAEAGTVPPLEGFTLLSSGDRTGSTGTYYVFGEVRNDTGVAAESVKIIVTLYNAAGTVVQVAFAFTEIEELEAGQTSPFEALIFERNGSTRYEIQIEGEAD